MKSALVQRIVTRVDCVDGRVMVAMSNPPSKVDARLGSGRRFCG